MFVKHIGKQGDRKLAIVFREVPGEEHMALVVFTEVLPKAFHDAIMKVIESAPAQQAENLGDVLFRNLLPDGRPILETLHVEGMIKKVATRSIIVTPNASSHVSLEELNNVIREMKTGEEAIKRMAELDSQAGMTGKVRQKDDFGREVGGPPVHLSGPNVAGSDAAKALDNATLAIDIRRQAEKMHAEAQGLLAESARLMKEASAMSGASAETTPSAPKRGRPRKEAVVDAAR